MRRKGRRKTREKKKRLNLARLAQLRPPAHHLCIAFPGFQTAAARFPRRVALPIPSPPPSASTSLSSFSPLSHSVATSSSPSLPSPVPSIWETTGRGAATGSLARRRRAKGTRGENGARRGSGEAARDRDPGRQRRHGGRLRAQEEGK